MSPCYRQARIVPGKGPPRSPIASNGLSLAGLSSVGRLSVGRPDPRAYTPGHPCLDTLVQGVRPGVSTPRASSPDRTGSRFLDILVGAPLTVFRRRWATPPQGKLSYRIALAIHGTGLNRPTSHQYVQERRSREARVRLVLGFRSGGGMFPYHQALCQCTPNQCYVMQM